LTISLYRTDTKRSPKSPESNTPRTHQDNHERLAFLKRSARKHQTENWS
jgi:hypothetical protein